MSENRVIGHAGKIPWHLPLDFRWFKHKTMGGVMLMGRKTLESLPQPLPGRECRVLTRQSLDRPGVTVHHDIPALLSGLPADKSIWVCGGEQVYAQLLPSCLNLYLTRVKGAPEGDTQFPAFEREFSLDQIIHENADFRVERWRRNGLPTEAPEPWPFA